MKKIALLFILTSWGCTTDFFDKPIEIDNSFEDSKLAPSAILGYQNDFEENPKDKIFVSYTLNPFENLNNQIQIIENASVSLTSPTQTYLFDYDENTHFYLNEDTLSFEPNTTYTLKIEAPGYETVTASQVFPEEVPILNAERSGNVFKVTINDNPNKKDYYLLKFFKKNLQTISTDQTLFSPVYVDIFGTIFDESGLCYTCILLKDTTFNGKQNFEILINHFEEESEAAEYIAVLYHTTEDYYKYDTSIRINEYAQDNPFVEPIIIHSNFENGLGIFTLMNKSEYSFNYE